MPKNDYTKRERLTGNISIAVILAVLYFALSYMVLRFSFPISFIVTVSVFFIMFGYFTVFSEKKMK
jgi:flagellar biosynthesis component FlhA